jgi:hypothetical protein
MAYGDLSFQNQNYKSADPSPPQQQQQQKQADPPNTTGEVIEDFLIKFIKDKQSSLLPDSNLKLYFVYFLIGLLYLLALILFINSQLQGKFARFLPVYLQKISKFEYGTYFAVFLLIMTVMTGLFNYNFTYIAVFLTGVAFLYSSTTKSVCASIRWPLFASSILLISFVLVNKTLCYFNDIKTYSFWYAYFGYLIVICIVLVVLDFLMYIPARCQQQQLNGSGDLFYNNKIV